MSLLIEASLKEFRTRRPHRKSRRGCFECKRRKVKCDELQPSCTRCDLTLQKCVYPPPKLSAQKQSTERVALPSPPCSTLSPSPVPSLALEHSPSCGTSTTPISILDEATSCASTPQTIDTILSVSAADLYHHYLEHTSHTLSCYESDRSALQFGIPTLALQSRPVLLSVLALSAVCLCCDVISKDPRPEVRAVEKTLMTGYQHYNQASEQIRELLSQPDPAKADSLLASALLLVPFAAATQRVNHWISSHRRTKQSVKLLSSSPRDVIVMMKGLRTTVDAFSSDDERTTLDRRAARDNSAPLMGLSRSSDGDPIHRHAMFPILAATSERAFAKLREQVASLCHSETDGGGLVREDQRLSACASAFDTLDKIRIDTFSAAGPSALRSTGVTLTEPLELDPEQTSSSHIGPWLQSYAKRHADLLPRGPWFLAKTSQAYLDLVLPLLDQRLESATDSPHMKSAVQLTKVEALALDIYAHWSVLMFLVGEELWYIGDLPVVTLTGMINRYGDRFVSKRLGDLGDQEQWWPGSMLRILRELEKCR